MDMFAAKLPSFSLNGQQEVKTATGGFLSLVLYVLVFLFAIMKIQHLFSKKNPAITTFTDPNAFGQEEKFNTGIDGFQLAVAVEHYSEGVRVDPRYLQFVARLFVQNGEMSESTNF